MDVPCSEKTKEREGKGNKASYLYFDKAKAKDPKPTIK